MHKFQDLLAYLKSLPSRPPAMLFTIPPDSALLAKVDAWLKRSHLEKARVLVIVKTRAIAIPYQLASETECDRRQANTHQPSSAK